MKLNQKTRWGTFIQYKLSIDDSWPDEDYYLYYLSKGVRYVKFPQQLDLIIKFLKDGITYEVKYQARNVNEEDQLLIQNHLMKFLRAVPKTSKMDGYPETFFIGKSKFKLSSIETILNKNGIY